MTEKRFKYSYSLEKVYDCNTFNGETTESYGTFECCDMLNQLNDENEQLKHDATVLIQANQDYRRENEQLKKDWDSVSHNWTLMYDEAKNKVEELSKENKHLKAFIRNEFPKSHKHILEGFND